MHLTNYWRPIPGIIYIVVHLSPRVPQLPFARIG